MTDSASFKRGMRRLASGVSLITTAEGDERHGFIATAVASVAADPDPTMLVCVNGSVSCHDVIGRASVFCVNLLAAGDLPLARQFSSSTERDLRFSTGEWGELASGAPVLATALVSFDCRVRTCLKVHTHTIFIGVVEAIAFGAETDEPLLYADGGFATLQPVIAAASPAVLPAAGKAVVR